MYWETDEAQTFSRRFASSLKAFPMVTQENRLHNSASNHMAANKSKLLSRSNHIPMENFKNSFVTR